MTLTARYKPEQQSANGLPIPLRGSASSQVAFMTVRTSRHDNMLGSSTVGSTARVSIARDPLDAANKGGEIYKKTDNLRATASRTHEARKHGARSRHRGRRCA